MDKREGIISVVTTPLGFFALALLIVEGFLGIIVIGSGETLTPNAKLTGMWMAIASFALIVCVVSLMVWKIPENLTLRGKDWMDKAKMLKSWADERSPTTKKDIDKLTQTEG